MLCRYAPLAQFAKARDLNLGINNITQIENLEGLKELRSLRLHSNILTSMAGIPPMKYLTTLSLQDNSITEIGKELLTLPALKELRLDSNEIAVVENIPKSLAYLNLSGNRITKLDVSAHQLCTSWTQR